MKCPTCGKTTELHLNESREKDTEYEEVEFICPDGHNYFVRIKEDDLLVAD